MKKIKEFIIKYGFNQMLIKASEGLTKTIRVLYLLAGILNLIFNNMFFGGEGNLIVNGIILFVGYPLVKKLVEIIKANITDELDCAVAVMMLWINSFIFLFAGVFSITIGEIPDSLGIPMLALLMVSSFILLMRLWKWRWFR